MSRQQAPSPCRFPVVGSEADEEVCRACLWVQTDFVMVEGGQGDQASRHLLSQSYQFPVRELFWLAGKQDLLSLEVRQNDDPVDSEFLPVTVLW